MSASLDDPVFGGRIPVVDQPLDYHVELGGQTTPPYHVTVFEYPRLERADARLVYPSYTGLEPRLVQDVRTVSVVEGTELTLMCYLNKPVQSATLDRRQGTPPIALAAVAGDKPAYQATIQCDQTRRLEAGAGRRRRPQEQQAGAVHDQRLPNQPSTLKPVFPARDLEVRRWKSWM